MVEFQRTRGRGCPSNFLGTWTCTGVRNVQGGDRSNWCLPMFWNCLYFETSKCQQIRRQKQSMAAWTQQISFWDTHQTVFTTLQLMCNATVFPTMDNTYCSATLLTRQPPVVEEQPSVQLHLPGNLSTEPTWAVGYRHNSPECCCCLVNSIAKL